MSRCERDELIRYFEETVARLRAELATAEQRVCDFQAAALLGVDPDGVTPQIAEAQVVQLRADLADERARCKDLAQKGVNLTADLAAAREREGDARRCAEAVQRQWGNAYDVGNVLSEAGIALVEAARRILAATPEPAPAQPFHSCARSTGMEQVDDDIRDDPAQHPDEDERAQPPCPDCGGFGRVHADGRSMSKVAQAIYRARGGDPPESMHGANTDALTQPCPRCGGAR